MTITNSDVEMFGCTEAELNDMLDNNYYARVLHKDVADLMLAMSILSDAQAVMTHGNTDRARQFINKSKFILSRCMDKIDVRGSE